MGFAKLGVNQKLLDALKEMGISSPTEIQQKTIPLLYEGKDVVGHSQTGSGKTAAFGLPIIEKIIPGQGTQALILTPTRELAVQVKEEIEQIGKYTGVKVVVIHGGVGFQYQTDGAKVSEIIVATPGRLMDHLERRTVSLNKIKFIVLDEADRMLDMGFERDVSRILKDVPKQRQTIMFSATMPISAQRMIKKYMKNPAYVEAEKHIHADLLKQIVYKVDRERKFSLLVHLIKNAKGTALVFCRTKRETDKVAKNLRKQDLAVRAVHGDLTQNKRQYAVNELKEGKIDTLVATDVAARGLHLPGVSHVYNYDVPDNADDYTHRIGRTARAGGKGDAIVILCKRDTDLFRGLIKSGMKIEEKPLPEFEQVVLVKDKFNLPRSEKRRQGKAPWVNRSEGRDNKFGGRNRSRSGGRDNRSGERNDRPREHGRRDGEEKDGLYGFKRRGGKPGFGGSKLRESSGFKGSSSRGIRRKTDGDGSENSGLKSRNRGRFKSNNERDSDKFKKKRFSRRRPRGNGSPRRN